MNSLLADPFAQDYPETLLHSLEACQTSCLHFSSSHLACGTITGDIYLYDLLTLAPVRTLHGHVRTVQSICWSKCGRYLLTAARDWFCNLWDLSTAKCLHKIKLDGPVWMADISPEDPFMFCASILDSPAMLITLRAENAHRVALPDDPNAKTKQAVLCSIFTPNGDYVIGGSSKGALLMWSIDGDLLRTWKLSAGSIKGVSLSTTAPPYLVTNSTDRIIRTVALPSAEDSDLEIEHKFQDIVNRLQWHAVCFSGNAEYVAASTYHSANDIYIWERQRGSLVKILEGPKEELVEIAWHPNKVLVAGVGIESGTVYLWGVRSVEKWGSFAPDFKELEENVEYAEKEDEFDILPEDETGQRMILDETNVIDLEGLSGIEALDPVIPIDLEIDPSSLS